MYFWLILTGIGSAALSAAVTALVSRHLFIKRLADVADESDDVLNLRLRNEFARGTEAGKSDELSKFSISYEPFSELHHEWFGMRKRAILGYDMQLRYNGFPIGHQTRYVTHSNVEYDQDNIDRLLNSEVASAVNAVAQLVATKGIGTKTLPRKRA